MSAYVTGAGEPAAGEDQLVTVSASERHAMAGCVGGVLASASSPTTSVATSPTNNVASSPTTWRHHQHDSATTHWAHFEGDLAWHKSALSKPCACKNTGGTYLPSSSPPCLGQNTLPPSPDFDCAPPPGSSSCDPHRGSTSGAPQEDGTPEEDAVDSLQRHRAVVRNGELAHGAVP